MKPEITAIFASTISENHKVDFKLKIGCAVITDFEFLSLDQVEDLELHYTNLVTQLQSYRKSVQGEG
jgi:glycosylphosphatidylinositol transamidase (GPIT) subunit GPI8